MAGPLRGSRFAVAWLVVLAALAAAFVPAAGAQQVSRDRVTLQLEGASARTILSCTVLDYTGESITIRTRPNVAPRSYPAAQVVEVQTPQTEPHMRGLDEFAAGRIASAAESFEQALREETREWVRREVLAMLIRCAYRQGDYAAAGTRFLAVVESDPAARHLHLMPLWWTAAPPDAAHETAARGWLVHASPWARLMGSSALLTTGYGPAAEAELQKLVTSGFDYRLHLISQAQLWRLRLEAGDVGREELDRWQARIDALPEALAGGPYYVLGQGRLKRREYDRAAAALLRLPLVHDDDHYLAARALLEAAGALESAGQRGPAAVLHAELRTRFGGTPFGQEAGGR